MLPKILVGPIDKKLGPTGNPRTRQAATSFFRHHEKLNLEQWSNLQLQKIWPLSHLCKNMAANFWTSSHLYVFFFFSSFVMFCLLVFLFFFLFPTFLVFCYSCIFILRSVWLTQQTAFGPGRCRRGSSTWQRKRHHSWRFQAH